MRQPTWLPDGFFSVMRQNLNPTFHHLAGLDARYAEFSNIRSPLGHDRSLHGHQWAHAEGGRFEPLMSCGRITDGERREMNARIARYGHIEFSAERGVRRLEQDLDVAATKHARHVTSAGQTHAAFAVGIHLY